MKGTLRNILALILAMLMALSLAACEEKNEGEKGGGKGDGATPVVKDPGDDPGLYLAMAMENTLNEMKDRYQGSPLAAIAGVLEPSGTVSVSGDVETENGLLFQNEHYAVINDLSLAYDLDEKSFLVNFDLSSGGIKAALGMCLSPDFVGISFPFLTDNNDFYGIRPRDLATQLPNSYLWETLSEELNVRDLEQIDAMLDVLWGAELLDVDGLVKDVQDLSTDFIKDLDVDYEKGDVELDGKEVSGYVFTASVDSEDLARMMEKVYDIILDMPLWDTLIDLQMIKAGIDSDVDVDQRELLAEMLNESLDGALEEIRSEDLRFDYTYYVADKKVVSMTAHEHEYGIDYSVNFFDGGDITGTVSGERVAAMDIMGEPLIVPTEFSFSSHVSDRGGYTHEITLTSDGETVTIAAGWDGDDLSLDFDFPYADSISLTCGLKTTKKGFEIKDLSCRNGDTAVHLPFDLTLTYTGGESITKPQDTQDILTMEDTELRDFLTGGILRGILSSESESDTTPPSVTP